MNRNENQNAVTLAAPRMQLPKVAEEQYGLDTESWRALTDAIYPNAKTPGAIMLALELCQRLKLDIFQRVVHIVPIYANGRTIESVWPGIAQLRVMAQRQEGYAGYGDCEFGPDITEEFTGELEQWSDDGRGGRKKSVSKSGVSVTYPEWAQFTVYRIINGERVALPGPKVYWKETYAWKTGKCSIPNEMWQKRPRGQLEKCAEAASWRRGFPDVLGNEYAAEEMMGRNWEDGAIDGHFVEVDENDERPARKDPPKAKPKRADYADNRSEQQETRSEQNSEPARERGPDNALDGPGVPANDDEWREFTKLFIARLKTLTTVEEVDQLEEAQKFRTTMAPPAIAAELLDEVATHVADLDENATAKDDKPAQDNKGADDA